jgi:hypothetical protein
MRRKGGCRKWLVLIETGVCLYQFTSLKSRTCKHLRILRQFLAYRFGVTFGVRRCEKCLYAVRWNSVGERELMVDGPVQSRVGAGRAPVARAATASHRSSFSPSDQPSTRQLNASSQVQRFSQTRRSYPESVVATNWRLLRQSRLSSAISLSRAARLWFAAQPRLCSSRATATRS